MNIICWMKFHLFQLENPYTFHECWTWLSLERRAILGSTLKCSHIGNKFKASNNHPWRCTEEEKSQAALRKKSWRSTNVRKMLFLLHFVKTAWHYVDCNESLDHKIKHSEYGKCLRCHNEFISTNKDNDLILWLWILALFNVMYNTEFSAQRISISFIYKEENLRKLITAYIKRVK